MSEADDSRPKLVLPLEPVYIDAPTEAAVVTWGENEYALAGGARTLESGWYYLSIQSGEGYVVPMTDEEVAAWRCERAQGLADVASEVKPAEWTSEPPSEPGWYWVRSEERGFEWKAKPIEIGRESWQRGLRALRWEYDVAVPVSRLARRKTLRWWPVPIAPPPAPEGA